METLDVMEPTTEERHGGPAVMRDGMMLYADGAKQSRGPDGCFFDPPAGEVESVRWRMRWAAAGVATAKDDDQARWFYAKVREIAAEMAAMRPRQYPAQAVSAAEATAIRKLEARLQLGRIQGLGGPIIAPAVAPVGRIEYEAETTEFFQGLMADLVEAVKPWDPDNPSMAVWECVRGIFHSLEQVPSRLASAAKRYGVANYMSPPRVTIQELEAFELALEVRAWAREATNTYAARTDGKADQAVEVLDWARLLKG